MITKTEQQQIKTILQDPKWATVENVATSICDRISYQSVVGDSEWETLSAALINEGKVRGIREFIQELFNQSQQV